MEAQLADWIIAMSVMNTLNPPEEGRYTLVTFPETQKALDLVWWKEKGSFQGSFYYGSERLILYSGWSQVEISAGGRDTSRGSRPNQVKSLPCSQLVYDIAKQASYLKTLNPSPTKDQWILSVSISSSVSGPDCPADFTSIETAHYCFDLSKKSCMYNYTVYTDTSI